VDGSGQFTPAYRGTMSFRKMWWDVTSKCTPVGVFGSFECRISNKEEDSELEMRAAEEF
jgi:hypothetical protein